MRLHFRRETMLQIAGAIALFDVLYLLVDHVGANYQRLMTLSAVDGLLVLSLVVLTGFVGQISFVQAELNGFGGLLAGTLIGRLHWNFWFALPSAVIASVLIGIVVGLPALRLRGLILGVVTIALALAFDAWVFSLDVLKPEFIARPSLFGWDLKDDRATFMFCLAVFVFCAWLVRNIQKSKTGRILASIRDAEVAARTSGVDITRYKLLAFGISAGLAGLAGVLLVLTIGTADKQSFTLLISINIAAVVILMGPNRVAAAFFGGIFLRWGGELLDKVGVGNRYLQVVLGAGLIIQLIVAPGGVVGQFSEARERLTELVRRRRDVATT